MAFYETKRPKMPSFGRCGLSKGHVTSTKQKPYNVPKYSLIHYGLSMSNFKFNFWVLRIAKKRTQGTRNKAYLWRNAGRIIRLPELRATETLEDQNYIGNINTRPDHPNTGTVEHETPPSFLRLPLRNTKLPDCLQKLLIDAYLCTRGRVQFSLFLFLFFFSRWKMIKEFRMVHFPDKAEFKLFKGSNRAKGWFIWSQYLRPGSPLTKLAFLLARATLKENTINSDT